MGVKWTGLQIAAAVGALFLVNGGLLTVYHYLRSRLYGFDAPVGMLIINEIGGAIAGACFLGLFLYLFFRKPIRPLKWQGWLVVHSITVLVYSGLHTSAHWGIRSLFYPLFGYGAYNPGNLKLRYAMELPNDIVSYSKWLLLFLAFHYYRRLLEHEKASAALEHSLAEATLKNLQAQMQPHFLMNALNAISSLIYSNPQAADEMIARLGSFLRRLLTEEQTQQISLAQEIDSVQAYIDIMQMRYEDRLKYRFQIEPAIHEARVPSLSLQPLVENSILHGVNPVDFSVVIEVTAQRCGDCVELAVRDYGKGMPAGAKPGVGLRNLRSRMAALYGERQSVRVEEAEGGGTIVRLLIPQNG